MDPATLKMAEMLSKLAVPATAKSMERGFGDLKQAVDGDKLANAATALKDFSESFNISGPALGALIATLSSETAATRATAMKELFQLMQTDTAQASIGAIGAIVNALINGETGLAKFLAGLLGINTATGDENQGTIGSLKGLEKAIDRLGTSSETALDRLGQSMNHLADAAGVSKIIDQAATNLNFMATAIIVMERNIERLNNAMQAMIEGWLIKMGLVPEPPPSNIEVPVGGVGGGNIIDNGEGYNI